ncbi:MAG TPA: SAM-dependent chlorinase/fluorinase [Candidatus Dormibacteraeota bacterium]|nr:SAM-dependent chlorinase/fluorinase [Candidatus Dormibacteraeota bacterium]
MPHRPIITLTTDFGTNDHFVGAVKGVILDIVPEAAIVDISHAVQAFDVLDGAIAISQTYSYFPTGTVHMVVVDPGVGTTRRPIIASSDGYHFVAPDNGVLSMVYAKEERIHVRHITSDHYFHQPVSNTFHARDVFAPVAAYLGKLVDSHKFGDEIEDYVKFAAPRPKATGENRLRAVVLKVDRFGNLLTNITPDDAPALFSGKSAFKIVVGSKEITEIRTAYAEGAPGQVFGILGSMGYLEVVANRAPAAQLTGAGKGAEVSVLLGEAAAAGKGA